MDGRIGKAILWLLGFCVAFLLMLGAILVDTKRQVIEATAGIGHPTQVLRTRLRITDREHEIETTRDPSWTDAEFPVHHRHNIERALRELRGG